VIAARTTSLHGVTEQNSNGPEGATKRWNREDWVAYADRILAGAHAFASPNNARITPPGAAGGYGRAVDGLEGFARTFLLAGFRIAGERGKGTEALADFYIRGIAAGVDPEAPDRWVRLDEHPQAKVEAASIALILDLTRPWVWDRLDAITQQRVIHYLSPVVGDTTYPQTNWVWFRLVVQTFLRSVGGPWSADDIAADLARHDSFARADGWMSDGDERSFDHYVGWALHLYPVLWSRMQGAGELANGRTVADIIALDRYLLDAVELVGADGSPLMQGRSLIYRFAAAAPFWVGVLAEVPSLSAGVLRQTAERIVRHFDDHQVPDSRGVLTMGWHDEWRALAQSYSGPGSPYWAVKGLLGVMLPADHPVWAADATPVASDSLRAITAPGWIVSATAADGIVRIVNHGTDHAAEGSLVGDSPLYSRIGYSTATSPLLNSDAWENPLEQSAALVDAAGRATHRASMQTIETRLQDDAGGRLGIAASTSLAHFVNPDHSLQHHGEGLDGAITVAGRITTHSLVRGPWEVRLVQIESIEISAALSLRIGGWPTILGGNPTSRIQILLGSGTTSVIERMDASPLGRVTATPAATFTPRVGEWVAVLVELTGTPLDTGDAAVAVEGQTINIHWPDGEDTISTITDHHTALRAAR
jgi:hypothetical protein